MKCEGNYLSYQNWHISAWESTDSQISQTNAFNLTNRNIRIVKFPQEYIYDMFNTIYEMNSDYTNPRKKKLKKFLDFSMKISLFFCFIKWKWVEKAHHVSLSIP